MNAFKIKIRTMRARKLKWYQIARETGLAAHRIQLFMEGLAEPTPDEEVKISAIMA